MPRQKKTDQKPTKDEPKQKKPKPLVGEQLLHQLKELENLSKEQKAKACGYYIVNKNGIERINMMQFLNALIDAEGIILENKGTANSHRGRTASYRIMVQTTGQLLIGSAYTKQLGLNPGDQFEISLGRKHIRLNHLSPEEN